MDRVKVISDTVQEFLGVQYFVSQGYFHRNKERLHRVVWRHFNGEIPEGFHIHHKDHNRANNNIENLEALSPGDHSRHHNTGKDFTPCDEARKKAAMWHKSEEGLAWHKEMANSEKAIRARTEKSVEKKCEQCDSAFFTTKLRRNDARFCSNKCKTAWRKASGVDDVTRICPVCDKKFQANKYNGKPTCSKQCSKTLAKLRKEFKRQNIG